MFEKRKKNDNIWVVKKIIRVISSKVINIKWFCESLMPAAKISKKY